MLKVKVKHSKAEKREIFLHNQLMFWGCQEFKLKDGRCLGIMKRSFTESFTLSIGRTIQARTNMKVLAVRIRIKTLLFTVEIMEL